MMKFQNMINWMSIWKSKFSLVCWLHNAGLSMPCLIAKVPVMWKDCMQIMVVRTQSGQDPVLGWFVHMSQTIQSEKARCVPEATILY